MKCPFCYRGLIPGEKRAFETLSEHVLDPNGEYGDPGLRDTFVCTCELSKDTFWNEDGEFYTGRDSYPSVDKVVFITEAIGSSMRRVMVDMNLRKLSRSW